MVCDRRESAAVGIYRFLFHDLDLLRRVIHYLFFIRDCYLHVSKFSCDFANFSFRNMLIYDIDFLIRVPVLTVDSRLVST